MGKFAKPHGNETWAMLMEKAFAKMYGNYSRLEGGQMHWALTAITGNPAVTFTRDFLHGRSEWSANYSSRDLLDDDEFFKFLLRTWRNGAFICCALIAPADKKGLIDGHAYSVLKLRTVHRRVGSRDTFRMVQIRNPHGGGEWKGPWSDNSSAWRDHPYVASKLQSDLQEDGTFWMQWEDFVVFWKSVHIVDCATNIRAVATPVYDEQSCCGPIKACLMGCFRFWCCCMGCFKLYCGRASARDFEGLKAGMDQKCGIDQKGLFCHCCEADTAYDADDE